MSEKATSLEAERSGASSFDLIKRARVIALVANGSSRRVAARFVGCAPSTISRAAARDPQFAEDLARAEERLEIEALKLLREAAKNERYWRAAAWLLERKNPEDFARRSPHLFTAAQVMEMFAEVLSSLSPEIAVAPRDRALETLGNLLLESDGRKGVGESDQGTGDGE